jgi:O-methyltransferase
MENKDLVYLYFDLLKKSLLNSIYYYDDEIMKGIRNPASIGNRAHTMIGLKRLDNIQTCFENIVKDNIEGGLIETGVWRGGATILMSALVKVFGENRKVFVADSFCGLPYPNIEKYPNDEGDPHWTYDDLKVSLEEVKNNFKSYDLLTDNVVFLEGWFEETLPTIKNEKLSMIRLDGDMYGSTWDALENLYPNLSVGGYLIVDDWLLHGAHDAIIDYRNKYGIEDEIENIDPYSVFWKKTK